MGVSVKVLLQPGGEPLTLAEAKLACRIDSDITAEDDTIANLITTARAYIEDTKGLALISQTILATFDRFPRAAQIGGLQNGYIGSDRGNLSERIGVTELNANWLDRAALRLPRNPVQSVQAVQYTDLANTLQTVDATLYRVDYMSDPARIIPTFGNFWPLLVQQTQSVKIRMVVGHGPCTSIAAAISVTGSQAVTPGSMYGIYAQDLAAEPVYAGTVLAIDTGKNRELVTVTAATATTFTATFAKTHAAGCIVQGGIPETTRACMKMLISHWYRNREAVTPGNYGTMPLGADALAAAVWNGEYT